jgi:SRP54-type protein, GTPase domain
LPQRREEGPPGKVLLVAGDIYRPAAIEQLQKLGEKIGAEVRKLLHRSDVLKLHTGHVVCIALYFAVSGSDAAAAMQGLRTGCTSLMA